MGLFEYIISILKWSEKSVHIGGIFYYLIYLSAYFSHGLRVDLEGRGTFQTPKTLSMLYQ